MLLSLKHSNLSFDSAIAFHDARIYGLISREVDRIQAESNSHIMVSKLHALLAHVFEISKEVHLFHASVCHYQQRGSNVLLPVQNLQLDRLEQRHKKSVDC